MKNPLFIRFFLKLGRFFCHRHALSLPGWSSQNNYEKDAHYQHAKAAGATIIAEPQDKPWGLRQYTAEDLEGYHWEFSQHLRDVPPAEWGAQLME